MEQNVTNYIDSTKTDINSIKSDISLVKTDLKDEINTGMRTEINKKRGRPEHSEEA